MAGKRKGRGGASNLNKTAKTQKASNGRRIGSTRSGSANVPSGQAMVEHSRQSNLTNSESQRTRGTARIVENNVIVEMSAEGQDTDFNEGGSQTDSMESDSGSGQEQDSTNNNATLAENRHPRQLEDGECEEIDERNRGQPSAKRPRGHQGAVAGTSTDQQDLRTYVDQKFNALTKMVELERELSEKNRELDLLKAKGSGRHCNETNNSQSELTIYRNAVEKSKRGSSSSEDFIDTSNEIEQDEREGPTDIRDNDDNRDWDRYDYYEDNNEDLSYRISEREMEKAKEMERGRRRDRSDRGQDNYARGRSHRDDRDDHRDARDRRYSQDDMEYRTPLQLPRRDVVGDKARRLVNEAEAAKARIFEVPGKDSSDNGNVPYEVELNNYRKSVSTLEMDEDYRMVAAHVDSKTRAQIINHSYIDFAKLLPRTRFGVWEDDNQVLQLVNRGGGSWFRVYGGQNTEY